MSTPALDYDPLLFGASTEAGIVAIEHVPGEEADEVILFIRDGDTLTQKNEPFRPFLVAADDATDGCTVACEKVSLSGSARLNTLLRFETFKDCVEARKWLSKQTGRTPSSPDAPYFIVSDPVQQYLMLSGKTSFLSRSFEDLHRMQVDIECMTGDGYDFCNAERESDRIIAIAMADQTGWSKVLSGSDMEEADLIEAFVAAVQERDPDVIEGHNIFNFDLPYIKTRAKRHGIKLELGRDKSVPVSRPSRFSAGERTIAYTRFDIFGRHVVDTLFLVQAYDVVYRTLDGYGLKPVAIHFGVAAEDRTYIEGDQISRVYKESPERLLEYVRDDVIETSRISDLLSRSSFVQAQILPFNYQNVCVRGNATKIDALLIREYLRQKQSLPLPEAGRSFGGGYTDMFVEGVIKNVNHCDIRSLYPSLMLAQQIGPSSDSLGVFIKALDTLRSFRIEAKVAMQAAKDEAEKLGLDALQTAFKILINSFYGYLGFTQGHFNDFDAADKVTSEGRKLLQDMIEWLEAHDAQPIEIDTDGIYFVPPDYKGSKDQIRNSMEAFRAELSASLPAGIEVEFDGEYVAMFSYKMKNYALLDADGNMTIKGAALKSRGLEHYQRSFLRRMIRMKLEERENELPALRQEFEDAIRQRQWPIEKFLKTENLQDSPEAYQKKRDKGKGSRRASYELVLASARQYKAGDQVAYYVTGDKKNVAVHENSKLATDWDPDKRDENVAYYLGKLDSLYKKFGGIEGDARQGELF